MFGYLKLIFTSAMDSFSKVDESELRICLLKSPNKQCNLDPIATAFVKSNIDVLAPIMHYIVNRSLVSGNFSCDLKLALVTPILKKASLDKSILTNYRPISNLAVLYLRSPKNCS